MSVKTDSGGPSVARRGREKLNETTEAIDQRMEMAKRRGREKAADDPDTITGRASQMATVIAVVGIGVAALIGIFIFAQVNDALPSISNNNLSNSKRNLVDGFGSAMDLVPVVLIVLLAALVIGVVSQMRN